MPMDSKKATTNDKTIAIARIPQFLGLHAKPSVPLSWFLVLIPFIFLICIYMLSSDIRHKKNPSDKILPSITQMATAMKRAAFEQNKRTGEYQLWTDTAVSLKRIGIGLSASALCGLFLGLHLGLLPGIRKLLLPFTTFVSIIPPLAVLPILFVVFGVDELAKVILIFIGTFPMISRDIYLAVSRIPEEQIIKSLTLGASQPAVAFRVIVPQIMPKLIDTIRINMGPAWLFLIASEAIAATSGLGYRVFLVRRYLAMDMIIPYVLWIVLIGLLIDWGLKSIVRYRYGWYLVARE